MKKAKSAQIGLGETLAVLIVFIILMIFGMVFYVQFQTSRIQKQEQKAQELRITELLTTIQSLPEIQCSSMMCARCGGSDLSHTYDLNKTIIAAKIIEGNLQYYVKRLHSTKIALDILDPRFPVKYFELTYSDPPTHILLYNVSLPFEINERQFYMPVNVYDPVTDMCYFGALNITVYTS